MTHKEEIRERGNLKILLLGSPRLEINGQVVELDTRKALAIIAYIAVQNEPSTREFLAAMLWPELDQSRARAALRRTLSALRRGIDSHFFDISRESVGLNSINLVDVDVWTFQNIVDLDTKATMAQLRVADDLYRDHFMIGFTLRDSPAFDEWQYFQEQKFRRDIAAVLEKLVERYSATQEWDRAIEVARRWLAHDLLQEAVHRTLMRLYALAGERNQALQQFEQCREILADELGVDPLEETVELAEQIRNDVFVPTRNVVLPIAPLKEEKDGEGYRKLPLVGRDVEWQKLWTLYNKMDPAGALAVIEGEAGIGKTRLAVEFQTAAAAEGAKTVMVRCYSGESNIAYGPLVDGLRTFMARPEAANRLVDLPPYWLAEASRLLPELRTIRPDIPAPIPSMDISAPGRLYAAVGAVLQALLAGPRPGVLVVDDVHWAPEATLDLLTFLVRRQSEGHLIIILTWRDADVPPHHPLRKLLAIVKRSGRGLDLHLERLDVHEMEALVATAANAFNREIPDLGQRLFRESEGNPYFAVEYLAVISENENKDWPLPGSVRDLLHSRLAVLNQMEEQLLQTAAVIGRSFPYDIWREASGRSIEETVATLEHLLRLGLVQEISDGELEYYFNHEKLRDLVLSETSKARRQLLHLRVAEAFLAHTRRPERLGPLAAPVGYHFEQAARPEEAADYYYQAGKHAQSVFANREAITYYQKALELGKNGGPGFPAAEIKESLGDCYALLGEYGEAIDAYEQAETGLSKSAQATVERKLGEIFHLQGKWKLAEDHFASALKRLEETEDLAGQASTLAAWSRTVKRQGEDKRALKLAQKALDLATQTEDERALAQAHNVLGMLAHQMGDLDQAGYHLEQSLALAKQLDDPSAQVAALNNLALVYQRRGETDQSFNILNSALRLCEKQGDRHREAAIHNNLADVLHAAGRETESMEHLKQGVAIYAEIGNEDGRWQPEIWKLTSW